MLNNLKSSRKTIDVVYFGTRAGIIDKEFDNVEDATATAIVYTRAAKARQKHSVPPESEYYQED